jgi:hypothetical protein
MMTKPLAVVILLLAGPAWAQVQVEVRTEKPQFLAGEPIFVIVEVKNVGTEQVAYGGASVKPPPELSVRNGERRVIKGLTGCGSGSGVGGGFGVFIDHPPMLQPGKSTTFRYLLRGYRLKPGTYELHVSGTADVAWREPSFVQTGAPRPAFTRSITEPVEGATIYRTVALTITAASEEALRAAYAPYVAAAESSPRAGREAVNGILEMAPAFLEPEIRTLVKQRGHERGFAAAAEALAEIDTPSSRAELIDWFDRSDDLQIRSSIVRAVAMARHPDNLPFLVSLLPGRSTQIDNRVRRDAALGIGMIGGEAAVEALRDAPRSPDPLVAGAVFLALGNTQSKSAIPILIERAEGQKGYVSNDVCTALITLTHRSWCGGVGLEETQKKWRAWWAANARDVRAYAPDDCPDRSTMPHIW